LYLSPVDNADFFWDIRDPKWGQRGLGGSRGGKGTSGGKKKIIGDKTFPTKRIFKRQLPFVKENRRRFRTNALKKNGAGKKKHCAPSLSKKKETIKRKKKERTLSRYKRGGGFPNV